MRRFSWLLVACLLGGCPSGGTRSSPGFGYRVVAAYPHDEAAFTQGLVIDEDGTLFEGTGLFGQSSLREVVLETGEVTRRIDLDERFFGEGITVVDDEIVQLTWRANVGFRWREADFEEVGRFEYPTEGWGITDDGLRLIMSDGTSRLYFLDRESFARIGTVEVVDDQGPVSRLNELEYIDGEVWANVWLTDTIVMIDPGTGRVNRRLDLTGLLDREVEDPEAVLNGIARDPRTGRIFVTGKRWPSLFEIELTE